MLQTVHSWNGRELTDFSFKDIPNIRKTMLYSWVMSGKFKVVDFTLLFGYHPG
jgi:hypothetical protein